MFHGYILLVTWNVLILVLMAFMLAFGDKINFLRGLKKTYSSLKVVYYGETWCTDLKKNNKGEKNIFFNRKKQRYPSKNFYIYLNKKKLVFTYFVMFFLYSTNFRFSFPEKFAYISQPYCCFSFFFLHKDFDVFHEDFKIQ